MHLVHGKSVWNVERIPISQRFLSQISFYKIYAMLNENYWKRKHFRWIRVILMRLLPWWFMSEKRSWDAVGYLLIVISYYAWNIPKFKFITSSYIFLFWYISHPIKWEYVFRIVQRTKNFRFLHPDEQLSYRGGNDFVVPWNRIQI